MVKLTNAAKWYKGMNEYLSIYQCRTLRISRWLSMKWEWLNLKYRKTKNASLRIVTPSITMCDAVCRYWACQHANFRNLPRHAECRYAKRLRSRIGVSPNFLKIIFLLSFFFQFPIVWKSSRRWSLWRLWRHRGLTRATSTSGSTSVIGSSRWEKTKTRRTARVRSWSCRYSANVPLRGSNFFGIIDCIRNDILELHIITLSSDFPHYLL